MLVKIRTDARYIFFRVKLVAGILIALALASSASADTIYKYRQPDGHVVFSNRPLPDATLLETIDYPPPPSAEGSPGKARPEDEERIRRNLAALEQAWQEVQDARVALAQAEERLRTGAEPIESEPQQLSGPSRLPPPAVGGRLPSAPPAAGGAQPSAPAAVGGPMGSRHGGGGRSAEFQQRQAQLEAGVKAAQERLDAALRRYNNLR
jgi:hypothetical protein